MKKILILLCCLFMSGCFFESSVMSDITLTTIYPIEYVTYVLYGSNAQIKSIYPNEINIDEYELSEKQMNNYAYSDMFIYDGLSDETSIALDFVNTNEKLKLVDGMRNLSYDNGIEELWLDPSNYLMVARNVKETLIYYTDNIYSKDEIETKYEELKLKISELDVDLTMIGKNASFDNLLVYDDALLFLRKYNINVISVDPDNPNYERNKNNAEVLINNGSIKYFYIFNDSNVDDATSDFVNGNELETLKIDTMSNLTEEQRSNNEDYMTIMKDNIDLFKKELLK